MRTWYFGSSKEKLREQSPIHDVTSVGAPLMLIANPNAPNENWSEVAAFRRKLVAAGKPPTFVEVTGGASVSGAEQAQLWGQIEIFLKQHLTPTP